MQEASEGRSSDRVERWPEGSRFSREDAGRGPSAGSAPHSFLPCSRPLSSLDARGGGTSSPLSCACRGETRLSRWRVGLLVKKCDKWLGIRSSSPSPPFRNVNGFLLDLSCVLKSESQSLLSALERFCRICSRERGRGCGLELSWPQAEWPRCDQGVGYFCRQGGEIGFRKRRDFSPIRANCF